MIPQLAVMFGSLVVRGVLAHFGALDPITDTTLQGLAFGALGHHVGKVAGR